MGLLQLNKWYSPQEICNLLHIKNDSNYSKTVKKRFDKMGVTYEYKTKKVKLLEEPQAIEDKLNYLLVLKGIKVENPREFAVFYHCLINFEEYQYCPWETRTKLLRENYGLTTDHRKL